MGISVIDGGQDVKVDLEEVVGCCFIFAVAHFANLWENGGVEVRFLGEDYLFECLLWTFLDHEGNETVEMSAAFIFWY